MGRSSIGEAPQQQRPDGSGEPGEGGFLSLDEVEGKKLPQVLAACIGKGIYRKV